jgi:hypothetical protein
MLTNDLEDPGVRSSKIFSLQIERTASQMQIERMDVTRKRARKKERKKESKQKKTERKKEKERGQLTGRRRKTQPRKGGIQL